MADAAGTRLPALFLVIFLLRGLPARALKTSGPSCAVPEAPRYLALPRCPPTNRTLEDAKREAWKFAPVVYTHPLEQYHLQSPDVWYNAGVLFLTDQRNVATSIHSWMEDSLLDALMFLPKSFVTVINSSRISEEERVAIIGGAPFVNGRSTAKVYYNVGELTEPDGSRVEGAWEYTYHLFYSKNGCSNQDFALSINGSLDILEYVACPFGIHEGDWERISALVCAEDLSLQQTAYSQHNWWETRDCTQPGQCPTELDDGGVPHPVTHAGFESHANYYEQSPLMAYVYRNATFNGYGLENVGGVWVGDRSLSDMSRKFMPDATNVVYLPTAEEFLGQALGNLSWAAVSTWQWALYPGNWGAPLKGTPVTFRCLYDNQTRIEACPDDRATNALKTAFSLLNLASSAPGRSSANDYEGPFQVTTGDNLTSVDYPSIAGPLYRTYSYQWLPERYSPIFKQLNGSVLTCPLDASVTLQFPDVSDFETATSIDTIVDYLVGICVGAVALSFIFVLLMAVPSILSKAASTPALLIAYGNKAARAGGRAVRRGGDALHKKGRQAAVEGAGKAGKPLPYATSQHGGGGNGAQGSYGAATAAAGKPAPLPPSGAADLAAMEAGDGGRATHVGNDVAAAGVPAAAAAVMVGSGAEFAVGSDEPRAVAGGADSSASLKHAVQTSKPSSAELDVTLPQSSQSTAFVVWAFCAGALYVAAVVLLILGTHQFVSNSVAALATHLIGKSGPIGAIKWLIIGGLMLTALCDAAAAFVVLVAHKPRFTFGRFSIRNWLYSSWVNRHAYRIHVVIGGLVMMVISIACILFGLGLIVITIQLAVRLGCSQIASANVQGISVADVCVTVPSYAATPICGWQALELCYDITNMGVLSLVLGGMLLLWSHIIWLVLLLLSMWRFFTWKVKVVPRAASQDSFSSLASAATTTAVAASGGVEREGEADVGWMEEGPDESKPLPHAPDPGVVL